MKATPFDLDAPADEPRIIIRHGDDGVEMVALPWGLRPGAQCGRPFTLVRAEGRTFPGHRCLVPASELVAGRHEQRHRVSLTDGDWFYVAGIWRPASQGWPEAFAILTIEANADLAPYQDRQMAVLRRPQRLAWLDPSVAAQALLRPQPRGTFRVERLGPARLRRYPAVGSAEATSGMARLV